MNVAILGTEQPSQIVADIIDKYYNSWLEQRLGEKLNVAAYVTGGGGSTPNIGNIPVLNPVQLALLYHKKLIDKIIFPRERATGGYEWHLRMLLTIKKSRCKIERYFYFFAFKRFNKHF